MTELKTTSWDNSNIYKSFKDPKITADIQNSKQIILELEQKAQRFETLDNTNTESIPLARECYRAGLDVSVVLYTAGTFASTATSVDAMNYEARDLLSLSKQLLTNLKKAMKPLDLFLLRAPQTYLDQFLNDESVGEARFMLNYAKLEEPSLLTVGEEVLLEGVSVDGFHAWNKLYNEISGSLKVEMPGETLGLAQASNILFGADSDKREIAYKAINKSWEQNEIAAANIQNAISGWRLENLRARSKKQEQHYFDKSCHQSKITRATLTTLMDTTYEQRNVGLEALRLMARELGIPKLGPQDLLAPYPAKTPDKKITFPEAMQLIIKAFHNFSPDMADFAKHMWEKNWIDATPTPNRGSGAYCTGFINVREPRVFITYEGNMKNVITLAHEIGHAYHSWVLRDLKIGETHYPMTLAETASIFAENLVRDYILEHSGTTEDKKAILWQEIESAATMFINIPARFEYERRLMELRKSKSVSAPELKELSRASWEHWYGDTLTGYNEMFWASKLHFSMSQVSFYNYPYLFGYLFSLGIYAKRAEYGEKFPALYKNILRDTGSYTAEDLIKKHFAEDISKPEFWLKSIRIVEKSVKAFAAL